VKGSLPLLYQAHCLWKGGTRILVDSLEEKKKEEEEEEEKKEEKKNEDL
jgi:hypothetical protein